MELVYLYIHSFRKLNNVEYNFSAKFHCELQNDTIHIDTKPTGKFEKFYGDNIINVTSIIGQNGTGKTLLLEYLSSFLFNPSIIAILITRENIKDRGSILTIHYHEFFEHFKEQDKSDLRFRCFSSNHDYIQQFGQKAKTIYLTNSLEVRKFFNVPYNINLSTHTLIEYSESELEIKGSFNSKLEPFKYNELFKQIDCITENRQFINALLGKPLEYLGFYFDVANASSFGWQFLRHLNKNQYFVRLLQNSIQPLTIQENWYIVSNIQIKKLLILSAFYCEFYLKENEGYYPPLDLSVESIVGQIYERIDKPYIKEYLDYLLDELVLSPIFLEIQSSQFSPWVDFTSMQWRIPISYAKGFINRYIKLHFELTGAKLRSDLIKFSWGISAGQNAYLSLYSRLNYLLTERFQERLRTERRLDQQNLEKIEVIWLLIDEAEINLHPEWQRGFVFNLISFLNSRFIKFRIQLILTSHSPIISADVLPFNTILLKKEGEKIVQEMQTTGKTFAANIYSLYHDSFYLSSVYGQLTEVVLNEVINYLRDRNYKIKNPFTNRPVDDSEAFTRDIIHLVADDFVADKLREMLLLRDNNGENLVSLFNAFNNLFEGDKGKS